MRCLYCGKELALFKRLRGGEFCSDQHRQRYQEEYTQLALNRLLQANSSKDPKDSPDAESKDAPEKETKAPAAKASSGVNGKEKRADRSEGNKQAEPIESPAIKRRERQRIEEAPAPASVSPKETLAPAARTSSPILVAEAPAEIRPPAAVEQPAPEPEPVSVSVAAAQEAPAPPAAGMLLEIPVPIFAQVAEISKPEIEYSVSALAVLPQAQPSPARRERTLILVGPVDSLLPGEMDWLAPRHRTLEVRDFVRSVPVVEIPLKPAGESDLPRFEEPLEISFEPHPVDIVAVLSLESFREFPPPAIEFRDFARADFDPSSWGETSEQASPASPSGAAPLTSGVPSAIEATRLEPMRVDPVHFESARPRSFHFEPVKIDPVFIERVAVKSDLADDIAQHHAAPAAPVAGPGTPDAVPSVSAGTPEQPIPAAITRPEPVTLHGIAPSKGKPMQVFASALPRDVEIQSPRQNTLPLRPVMVLGPAAPAAEAKAPSAVPEKPEAPKPELPKPEPQKQEPRVALGKRKPEVRVLSLPVKAEPKTPAPTPVKVAEAKPEIKAEPKPEIKAEPKPVEAAKSAAKLKEPPKEAASKPPVAKEPAPKEAAKDAKKEDSRKPAAPTHEDAPYRPAPLNAAPPIPDLLGLPTLSLENQGNVWTRLPVMFRVGIAAAILAAGGAGIFLTSRGSSATTAKGAKPAPQAVVEAGPALASTAGWAQDWFADPKGSKTARHVDVLRGSLALRDYRLEMEGQIDQGGIGWVFRANNKSFYAEKIAVVKPGLEPTLALVRIAVVDGQEVMREQLPLPLKAHLDTQYKIRVDAVGHRFVTYVQDQQVDDWTDTRIDAGGAGLYYDGGDSAHLKGTLNVIPLKEK
ncbi:MAG TPA: hypothetical protein VGN17_12770 [Bryobacteraceae bacterium]|jgi:hypothetical protein